MRPQPARLRALVLTIVVAACGGSATASTPPSSVPAATPTSPAPLPTTTSTTIPPTTTTTTTIPPLDIAPERAVERMRADLDILTVDGPRVAGSAAEAAALAHFARTAEDITGTESTLEAVPLPNGLVSANAWAAAVGRPGAPTLVVGAHIDSVAGAPGADDNGSGVVILLELLRRLADDPPPGLRVVVVAFGSEERIGALGHHHGSRAAVTAMEADGALPDHMLSVDMVGLGGRLYAVDHRGNDASFADDVAIAAADAGVPTGRLSRGDISDHVPFARAGVLAAHLWRPDNPAWHTAGDDTVADQALLDTLSVVEAVVAMLSHPDPAPPSAVGTPI